MVSKLKIENRQKTQNCDVNINSHYFIWQEKQVEKITVYKP